MALSHDTYQEIYSMLDEVTPIDFDCGTLCGAACCGCEDAGRKKQDELGIYLMPGEESMLEWDYKWLNWTVGTAQDFFLPFSWRDSPVYFVRCKDPRDCHRSLRSIQCRTFPLMPYLTKSGTLTLMYNNMDLPYTCPLIKEKQKLNPEFLEKTHRAWSMLLEDPKIYDLIQMESDNARPDLTGEEILYPEGIREI